MTNVMITVPQVDHLLKTCVFLGFEADPSFNIVSRIRGPNVSFFFIHLPHFSFRLVFCSSFSFSICSRQLVYFVFFSCEWGATEVDFVRSWRMWMGSYVKKGPLDYFK